MRLGVSNLLWTRDLDEPVADLLNRRGIDAIDLTRELIRRPSVTPADAGAMDVVEATLQGLPNLALGR